MIALLLSVLLFVYILLPGVLLRAAFSTWFIPFKQLQRTRYEDALSSISITIIPLLLVLVLSSFVSVVQQYPGPPLKSETGAILQDSRYLQLHDYETFFLAAYYLEEFSNVSHRPPIWASIGRVLVRQFRFACWFYALLLMELSIIIWAARNYWRLQNNAVYSWLANSFLLPNISEWPPLFEGITSFPPKSKPYARVDVLTDGDHLYKGVVDDYLIGPTGELTGLLLSQAIRFDRKAWEADRAREIAEDKPAAAKSDDYWIPIPSANFYLPSGRIININVSYEFENPEVLLDAFSKVGYLSDAGNPAGSNHAAE